jgi:hypothetical protein
VLSHVCCKLWRIFSLHRGSRNAQRIRQTMQHIHTQQQTFTASQLLMTRVSGCMCI